MTERLDGRAWRRATVERALSVRQAPAPGEVPRVVVEVVTAEGERGLVTVSLREGALHAIDDRGERGSALVLAALAWLEAMSRVDGASDPGRLEHARTSLLPSHPAGRGGASALARDVALALVRAGIEGARRGALDDHLRRARSGADARLARWLVRVEGSLAAQDVPALAALVRGALSPASPRVTTRVDARLVEFAREHLDAARPRGLERRYLVELASGAIWVEELDDVPGSLGPMPRTVEVGLAELHEELAQPLVRILQYTTTPSLGAEAMTRLSELALRDVSECLERVEAELRASPGWAEPVVLFAPATWEPGLRALDAKGIELPFATQEDAAACQRLAEVVDVSPPVWLALRACPSHGRHGFVPLSCAARPAVSSDDDDPADVLPRILRLRG